MKARIVVTLKNGVLDPQGQAIENALGAMGLDGVDSVRQGKVFEVEGDLDQAKLEEMCERLLANTVIEDYAIETR